MGRPHRKRGSGLVTLALFCALLGGFGGGALCASVMGMAPGEGDGATSVAAFSSVYADAPQTVEETAAYDASYTPREIYAQAVSGVVCLTALCRDQAAEPQTQTMACGSGFVLSADGYLVTNYHVVADTTQITASFCSGQEYTATLVVYDAQEDVALLKIDAQALSPLEIAPPADLLVGEQVSTIGNPLGEVSFAMTVGYISALERQVETDSGAVLTMLQTDCAINSGNSGGPLLNSAGKVIGIVSAKCRDESVENVGFAIPIAHVMEIIAPWMKTAGQ